MMRCLCKMRTIRVLRRLPLGVYTVLECDQNAAAVLVVVLVVVLVGFMSSVDWKNTDSRLCY